MKYKTADLVLLVDYRTVEYIFLNQALKQVLVYLPISKLQSLSSTVFFHNIISQGLESHSINYYYLESAMHNTVWKNNESFRRFYPP